MLDWEDEEDPRTGILYRPAQNPLYMLSMALIGILDSLVIFLSLGFLCSGFQLRFIFWHLNRESEKARKRAYYGDGYRWYEFKARWRRRWRKIRSALENIFAALIVAGVVCLVAFGIWQVINFLARISASS